MSDQRERQGDDFYWGSWEILRRSEKRNWDNWRLRECSECVDRLRKNQSVDAEIERNQLISPIISFIFPISESLSIFPYLIYSILIWNYESFHCRNIGSETDLFHFTTSREEINRSYVKNQGEKLPWSICEMSRPMSVRFPPFNPIPFDVRKPPSRVPTNQHTNPIK